MGVFAYKGRNGRGDLVEGTLDGDDSGVIANQLMNTGITPVEITRFAVCLAAHPASRAGSNACLPKNRLRQMDVMSVQPPDVHIA